MSEENADCATHTEGDIALSNAISSLEPTSPLLPAHEFPTVEDYPEGEEIPGYSTDEEMAWPDSFFPDDNNAMQMDDCEGDLGLGLDRPSAELLDDDHDNDLDDDSGYDFAGTSDGDEIETGASASFDPEVLEAAALGDIEAETISREPSPISTPLNGRSTSLNSPPSEPSVGHSTDTGSNDIHNFQASNGPGCCASLLSNMESMANYVAGATSGTLNHSQLARVTPPTLRRFLQPPRAQPGVSSHSSAAYEHPILLGYCTEDITSLPVRPEAALLPQRPMGKENFLSHRELRRKARLFAPRRRKRVDVSGELAPRFYTRRIRPNPDFLRAFALESNMKRCGKLEWERPLRSREILMPRGTLYRPSLFSNRDFRSATRKWEIPERWTAVSVE